MRGRPTCTDGMGAAYGGRDGQAADPNRRSGGSVSGLLRLGQCRLTELKDAARSRHQLRRMRPAPRTPRSLLLAIGTPALRVPSDHSAQLHRINRRLDEVGEPLRKES